MSYLSCLESFNQFPSAWLLLYKECADYKPRIIKLKRDIPEGYAKQIEVQDRQTKKRSLQRIIVIADGKLMENGD